MNLGITTFTNAFGKLKPMYAQGYTANLLLLICTVAFGSLGGIIMKVTDYSFETDIAVDFEHYYRFSLVWWIISLLLAFVFATIIARNLTNQVGPSQQTMIG